VKNKDRKKKNKQKRKKYGKLNKQINKEELMIISKKKNNIIKDKIISKIWQGLVNFEKFLKF